MNHDNSIVQDTALATLNELVNTLECLAILMAAAVKQLNQEQEDDEISEETVAAISGLFHLLHCSRNAAISCSEQLQHEQQEPPAHPKTSLVNGKYPLS